MTTIIGIKADKENEKGIVLVADRQHWGETPEDIELAPPVMKGEMKKIYTGSTRDYALAITQFHEKAICGHDTGEYFMKNFTLLKTDNPQLLRDMIRNKLESGFFPWSEFLDGNCEIYCLFATNFNGKLELYQGISNGEVRPVVSYTAMGTGIDLAYSVLIPKLGGYKSPLNISLREALRVGVEAEENANHDLYTSGLDLIVVEERKILDYGTVIDQRIKRYRETLLRQLLGEYGGRSLTLEEIVNSKPLEPLDS